MFKSPFYFYSCGSYDRYTGRSPLMRSAQPKKPARPEQIFESSQKPEQTCRKNELLQNSYIISAFHPENTVVAAQKALELNPQLSQLSQMDPAVIDFFEKNPRNGFLKLKVSTAQEAIPLYNAAVKVYLNIDGTRYEVASETTDASGLTLPITLRAPDKALSLDPRNPRPYATYDVVVTHPDFRESTISNIPIFDGITTMQNVDMQPAQIGLQQPTFQGFREYPTRTAPPERRSHRNISI